MVRARRVLLLEEKDVVVCNKPCPGHADEGEPVLLMKPRLDAGDGSGLTDLQWPRSGHLLHM